MDNKPKRVMVRALSLISLLIFALLLIVAYASSSVMTGSVFRRLAAGGRLHDYESADLLRAAICGVLSVAAVFPGVLGLCGRTHLRSALSGAISLALLPIERAVMLALRYYVYCRSSISSSAIRERFVSNSYTLEAVLLALTLLFGLLAFFSKRASEYDGPAGVMSKSNKLRMRALEAANRAGFDVSDIVLTSYDGEKTAVIIFDEGRVPTDGEAVGRLFGILSSVLPGYTPRID